ncbi:MAG: tape measure protein [Lentisphaeria bacterium]|nr:tape measure protein [Lentisphaeria bacterium]
MADSNVMIRIGAHVSGAVGGIRGVYGALDSLTQKASSLAVVKFGSLISLATAGLGITGIGLKVAKLGAHAETTRLAFQTMLGSIEKGDAMMAKLDRFSNSTPYSGDQVNQAAKTLLAFGISAGSVEEELRKVGDVAAGTGKDFNELANIYGKVFAKGKADSMVLNQMIAAGIPIVKLLGEQYGKSGDEVYTMAEKGEISAKAISDAFAKMSGEGGVYANMMEKQSQTVSGMWGAIVGQLEYAGSLIGESIAPIVKKILAYFQGWADELVAMSQDGRMVQYLSTVALTAINMGATVVKAFVWIKEYGLAVFRAIGDIGVAVWYGMQGSAVLAFTGIMRGINYFWEYLKAVFSTIGRIYRMEFNGLLSLGASVFVSLVDVALKAVNAVIRALNKIPGVEIDTVKEPAFVGKVRKFAQEAGKKAADDLNAVLTGKDFKEATRNAQQKNSQWDATDAAAQQNIDRSSNSLNSAMEQFSAAGRNIEASGKKIDAFADRASDAITKWQQDEQQNLARRRNAKLDDKDKSSAPDNVKTKAVKPEKTVADSLTKIGLYGNFGSGQIKSIDRERNSILKDIRELLARKNEQTGEVLS